MSELYYLGEIRRCQQSIDLANDEIRRKQEELEHLNNFHAQHQRSINDINEYFDRKSQKVNSISLDVTKVKSFSIYKDSMLNLINSNERGQLLQKKQEEQNTIKRAIQQLEEEINQLQRQIYQYDYQISDLYSQLNRERMSANGKK